MFKMNLVIIPVLAVLMLFAEAVEAATRMQNISGRAEVFSVATGLNEPCAVAADPRSTDIYVAEKGGRVLRISESGTTPVIEPGAFTVDPDVPRWLINEDRTRASLASNKINNPGGIGLTTNGHLFLAEDVENGRVLEFIPTTNGTFKVAKVHGVPWLEKPFAWDDLYVDREGRVFVAGSDPNGFGGLFFGSVLMRDLQGIWWVVDYAPFSRYSSMYLSTGDDIMVVLNRDSGEVVTWDIGQHVVIGVTRDTVEGVAENLSLLDDGSYVVSDVPEDGGNCLLYRVNPLTAEKDVLCEGFQYVTSMAYNQSNGFLYVADQKAGVVAEVRAEDALLETGYILQRAVESATRARGEIPDEAPEFLSVLATEMAGTQKARKKKPEEEEKKQDQKRSRAQKTSGDTFSLRDFATKIPMVAGKVKTVVDTESPQEADPVKQLDFLLFFPGKVIGGTDLASPSLTFFSVVRKSGKVEQSKLLFDNVQSVERVGNEWMTHSDSASMYIPLATCNVEQRSDGQDLNIAFLGLGFYSDYYLRLNQGMAGSTGRLLVENPDGTVADYPLTLVDNPDDPTGPANLIVYTGRKPPPPATLGWLRIGRVPVTQTLLFQEDQSQRRFKGVDKEINSFIKRIETERRVREGVAGPEAEVAEPEAEAEAEAEGETPAEEPAPETAEGA